MGKNLSEYKNKIIAIAIQQAEKDGLGRYYAAANLAEKLRGKIEFTGDIDRDLTNSLAVIKSMVSDLNKSYI